MISTIILLFFFSESTFLGVNSVRRRRGIINNILFTNSSEYKLPCRVKQKFSASKYRDLKRIIHGQYEYVI